jgi:hypothetical protein
MNWWRLLTIRDLVGYAVAAAIIAAIAFIAIKFPTGLRNNNNGFGPGWDCTNTGSGEPVCFKRVQGQTEPGPAIAPPSPSANSN